MKILVTGATGFIGRRIVKYFLRKGHLVTGSGRSTDDLIHENYNFLQTDLTNKNDSKKIVKGMDIIIHCAGKAGAWGSKDSYIQANIIGTRNLIELCTSNQRVINISSPSIYFQFKDQFLLTEDQLPPTFSNAYAETKYKAEKIVEEANKMGRVQTLSLRPRGVIGAGDRNWLPRIIKLREQDKLIQPGDGNNVVDFTSIDNLIHAIELCLTTSEHNLGCTYNITNGEPEKLWNMIDYSLISLGLDGKRKKVPSRVAMSMAKLSKAYHQIRKSEGEPALLPIKVGVAIYSMTLDISAAKNKLGYRPQVKTREAIEEFVQWWKEKK